jgi:hypothetical protein
MMTASFQFKAASVPVSRYNRALTKIPENPKREIRKVKKAGQEQGTRLHDFFSPGRTATNTPEHLEPGRAKLPEAVWPRGAPGLTPGPFPRGETL